MENANSEYDYNVWYTTKDPNFVEISKKSRVPEKWLAYESIKTGQYKNSFIKPINPYVQALVPAPKLVSINNNTVRLRQGNHAEFFLLLETSGNLRHIDRPWMRQYYNTEIKTDSPVDCFPNTFKFYAPWYIDADIEIKYEVPLTDSPFCIVPTQSLHSTIKEDAKYIEPDFIVFNFKSVGSHMEDKTFAKIKRQSAMFDIVFEADDIILERVRNFYEKD
jgi:hypothetical protein